jgi:cyclopropane fatty-acyl-phospholipid synthase-like methyltransferase
MSDDPKRIVEAGFDVIADRFGAWRAGITGSPDEEWLADLLSRLPGNADVLELGCGEGQTARRLVDAGLRYVGVDISGEQLRRARALVPEADFRQGDFTELNVRAEPFDAVVSLYVLNHLPRADLPGLLARVASWLRPGGYLLATFGQSGWEGVQEDWLGVPMFFGSHTKPDTLSLLSNAGFVIERDEIVSIVEPVEGPANFLWVLARR